MTATLPLWRAPPIGESLVLEPDRTLSFTLDGAPLSAAPGETIQQAAGAHGIVIPTLCHSPGLEPEGSCRVCMVRQEGARVMLPACHREVEDGMVLTFESDPEVATVRRTVLELLAAGTTAGRSTAPGTPDRTAFGTLLAADLVPSPALGTARLPHIAQPAEVDTSSPVIAFDASACVNCNLCLRGCADVQVHRVIGKQGIASAVLISFDEGRPMGGSTCVSCGECRAVCPTTALTEHGLGRGRFDAPGGGSPIASPFHVDSLRLPISTTHGTASIGALDGEPTPLTTVDSACPWCGVGCQLRHHVDPTANRILATEGVSGSNTEGRLCVKGRYGTDFVHHPDRLTHPWVRRADAPKTVEVDLDAPLSELFRPATWDEALDIAAAGFQRILASQAPGGPSALAGFGSAKASNEDAYATQKLIRAAFGTNNVDHCTRLCHASSVTALLEGLGSGSVSNVFRDVEHADACLVIGSNTTANHPVAATYVKQAAAAGMQLIVADPRRIELMEQATHSLVFRGGSDVALILGLLHVIVREGLTDETFLAERTEAWPAVRAQALAHPPDLVAALTGIPAHQLEAAALAYGRAERAMILWGMGISQHIHGTDNARALISLACATGNIGRRGTGLHPLRGQNNVQGASDAGLIPMVYPGYTSVTDPEVRARFEAAWSVGLDPEEGLTVTEIMGGAIKGTIRGMVILGENPFLSDPDLAKVRKALASLEWMLSVDVVPTETVHYADVILPATAHLESDGTYTNTDRRVQLGRAVLQPPGEAREDWWIISEIARRLGRDWGWTDWTDVHAEFRGLVPAYAGASIERLEEEGSVLWPVPAADHPGTSVLFMDSFPIGRARLKPVAPQPPHEEPDAHYPFLLTTGRVLEHWHTGTMTRRSPALDAIEPAPFIEVHPDDLEALGASAGAPVKVTSRRGSIVAPARPSTAVAPGTAFTTFHFHESPVNELTSGALDPWGKIPGFKVTAVRLDAV